MDPLDLSQFKVNQTGELKPLKPKRSPRHKAGRWFLKGPIPGEWLTRAAKLPGRVFNVAVALCYLAGLKKAHTVKPTWDTWRRFGVSPDTGGRGLTALEQAGLVAVDRYRGRCPVVTILETPADSGIETSDGDK